MDDTPLVSDRPVRASWPATLVAILPLLAYGGLVLAGLPLHRLLSAAHLGGVYRILWADVVGVAPMPALFYLLVLGGLLAAWRRDFPRWSDTYLGWMVLILATGMDRPRPGWPYPWLVWVPFLLTLVLSLALRPSPAPLRALARGWRRDGTRASFALLGFLSFLLWVSFDEMPGPRALSRLVVTAILIAGAVGYLRATGRVARLAALLGGAALSLVLSSWIVAYAFQTLSTGYGPAPAGMAGLAWNLGPSAVLLTCFLTPALVVAALNRIFPHRSAG